MHSTRGRTLGYQQKMVGSHREFVHLPGFVMIQGDDDDQLHSRGRRSRIHHSHLARTARLGIAVEYKEERRGSFWQLRWIPRKG